MKPQRNVFFSVFLILMACIYTLGGLTGCVRNQGAQTKPKASITEVNFHYAFAHVILPQVLAKDHNAALSLALSDQKQDFLLKIWDLYSQKIPSAIKKNPAGLKVLPSIKLHDGSLVTVIAMPEPDQTTEAYYVAYITNVDIEKNNSIKVTRIHYYTLEKTLSLDQNNAQQATVLGAWEDGKHLNFGSGPSPQSYEDFMQAVIALYMRKNT